MKVHVFDTYVTIKDREGHPDMDDTLLEKLDEMLTTYGVPHAFTLPHEKTMEDCPEATLEVAYDSSDDITFSLVYILFNKTYTNLTVGLETYEITDDAGEGFDVKVKINLKQYRAYGTKTVTVQPAKTSGGTATATVKAAPRPTTTAPKAATYTVKSGDCLWNIAKKQLGNGADYTKIYNLNKDKIKNPNLIYPGQVLTLPS